MRSRLLLAICAALSMAGCATAVPRTHFDATERLTENVARQAEAGRPAPWFRVHDDVFLGAKASVRKGKELPSVFDSPAAYQKLQPVTLNELSDYIAATYAIPVVVTEEALQAASKAGAPAEVVAASAPMTNLPPIDLPVGLADGQPSGAGAAAPPPPPPPPRPMGAAGAAGGGMFLVNYTGNLRGLLDHIASRSNNGWRYDNGRVVIFHTDTRVFRLRILPGTTTMTSTITNEARAGGDGGGSGGGSGGASSNSAGGTSTSLSVNTDAFTSAAESIKSMLSPNGKATSAPSLATITVTDVPTVLDRVERFVEQMNEVATRHVYLDVKVYAVEHNRADNYGIQWDLVWRSLGSSIGVNLNGGTTPTSEGVGGQFAVLGNGPFNGTSLLLQALSSQGRVSQVTSASVVTLSGQAIPVQIAEEAGYISSSEVSLVPNVGQQVSRTASKVTTGFSMVLLPVVNDGRELLLQAQLNLSNLRQLRQIGSPNSGSFVEVPLVGSRQILQRVPMTSGQTLVLTGFEQDAAQSDDTGLGASSFKLLGGSSNASRRRTTLVFVITPQIATR